MAGYRIFLKKSVQKDLSSIPLKDLNKILNSIQSLENDHRPSGCEKWTGLERYRLRQGRYRISYSIQDDELTIWVVTVGHRKDIYR